MIIVRAGARDRNTTCNGCDSGSCPGNDWCENRKCSLEKGIAHCYACEEDCKKGLLSKIKPYGFSLFIKRYGEDKLLACLVENEKRGIVYHREGTNGDYDNLRVCKEIRIFPIVDLDANKTDLIKDVIDYFQKDYDATIVTTE